MIDKIIFRKNKLVLLSKLLKDMKNMYKDMDGKELVVYKLTTQRRLVETFFDEKNIDEYIDKLKQKIYRIRLKEQVKEELE